MASGSGGIGILEGRRNHQRWTEGGFNANCRAGPYVFEFDPRTAVLVIIDMQRDFVDPGWYVKRLRVTGRAAHGASYSTRSLGKIRQKSTLRS